MKSGVFSPNETSKYRHQNPTRDDISILQRFSYFNIRLGLSDYPFGKQLIDNDTDNTYEPCYLNKFS